MSIHGVPAGQDYLIEQGKNWTAGCISLRNADIHELFGVLDKGIEVTIRP